jgi:hypothetical protein
MMLDVFDIVATKTIASPDYFEDPETWDVWIIDSFSTSPILRETYDKNSDWWCKDLKILRKKAQEKLDN